MAKVERFYVQPRYDLHPLPFDDIPSWESSDDSPPNSFNHNSKAIFNDNSDSGCATGSDDDCIISYNLSAENSSDSNSPSLELDFWNKNETKLPALDSNKDTECYSCNFEGNDERSSNEASYANTNTESDNTFFDFLSNIHIEDITQNSSKNENSASNISEVASNSDDCGFDDDLYGLLNAVSTQKETEIKMCPFASQSCDFNTLANPHASDFEDKLVSSNNSNTEVSMSDMLASVCFDNDRGTIEHFSYFLPFDSGLLIEGEDTKLVSIDASSCMPISNHFDEKSSVVLSSSHNTESNFSDLLASICLDDDYTEKKIISSLSPDINTFDEIDITLSDVFNACKVSTNPSNSVEQEIGAHLLVQAENNARGISLATLAEQQLSLKQPLTSTNDTCDITTKSIHENIELYSSFPESPETSTSAKLPTLKSTNSDGNLSMLDLLSVANMKVGCSVENKYTVDASTINQLDETSANLLLPIHGEPDVEDEVDFSLKDLDLRACLKLVPKSAASYSTNSSVTENSLGNITSEKFNTSFFQYSHLQPMAENEDVCLASKTAMKSNAKRSLFAKALSSKPRKDQSAMNKVLNLKQDLCNYFFNLSSQSEPENKAHKDSVSLTNQPIVTACGRRVFGKECIPCELM